MLRNLGGAVDHEPRMYDTKNVKATIASVMSLQIISDRSTALVYASGTETIISQGTSKNAELVPRQNNEQRKEPGTLQCNAMPCFRGYILERTLLHAALLSPPKWFVSAAPRPSAALARAVPRVLHRQQPVLRAAAHGGHRPQLRGRRHAG
ncbi:uncharacterized protein PG986_014144 [Apiospora aurea]|uniref:Uncharacterized protein n=1 Tax=Apiospora aurea TaxID=335848 RepID=A0ABR1PS57_9PEZI